MSARAVMATLGIGMEVCLLMDFGATLLVLVVECDCVQPVHFACLSVCCLDHVTAFILFGKLRVRRDKSCYIYIVLQFTGGQRTLPM